MSSIFNLEGRTYHFLKPIFAAIENNFGFNPTQHEGLYETELQRRNYASTAWLVAAAESAGAFNRLHQLEQAANPAMGHGTCGPRVGACYELVFRFSVKQRRLRQEIS